MKVYIDLGGVLYNFKEAYEKYYGVPVKSERDIDFEKIQKEDAKPFWITTWAYGGKRLWESLKPLNPTILTSHDHIKQKQLWVKTMLGTEVLVIFLNKKLDKSGPGTVFIDDCPIFISPWRIKGGISIHHKNADDTLAQLKFNGVIK